MEPKIILIEDKVALVNVNRGPKGATGAAATITVGSVTTGAPGSEVGFSNIGTPWAAVFSITIPRGDKGEKGDQGDQGNQGNPGTTTWSGITDKPTTLSGFGITDAININLLAAPSGVATLDAGGKLLSSQLPNIAIVEYLGAVANQAAMLALTGQKGDWATRTDLGSTWIITGNDPSIIGGWTQLSYPTAPVTSVSGKTGAVTLNKSDVGLPNVDNTADLSKPVSGPQATADAAIGTAAANALAAHAGAGGGNHPVATTSAAGFLSGPDKTKLDSVASGATANATNAQLRDRSTHTGTQSQSTIVNLESDMEAIADLAANANSVASNAITMAGEAQTTAGQAIEELQNHVSDGNNPHGVNADQVGLGNVDDTSDADKPVSTAQAAALAGKQPLDGDLSAIAAISSNGYLRRTGANTWTVDAAIPISSGGTGATTAAAARTALGSTTVGDSFFTTANPSAIVFPRINANNTLTYLNAAAMLVALGAAPAASPTFTGTTTMGAASASSLSVSGSLSAASITIDAVISTASRIVGETNSRNLANSDNGKRIIVTGASAVVLTQPSGLTSGFCCEIINKTTGSGSVAIATSGTTINGDTPSLLVDRGLTASVAWTASNAYQVSGHDTLRQIRQSSGVLRGSDATINFHLYAKSSALGSPTGFGASLRGDAIIGGLATCFGDLSAFSLGNRVNGPSANGRAYAYSLTSAEQASYDAGPMTTFSNRRLAFACRFRSYSDGTGMTGRRSYIGMGSITAGAFSAISLGKMGLCLGGYSDFIQVYNGSAWADTALRWKNGSTLLQADWDVQIISGGGTTVLQARAASNNDLAAWTTLLSYSGFPDGNAYASGGSLIWTQVLMATLVDNATFDAAGLKNLLEINYLSIADNGEPNA